MGEPHEVTEGLRKFWHATFPTRPRKDWDAMTNRERIEFLRETVEHLDGCDACRYRIPQLRQAVIRARFHKLTGEE